MAAAVVARMNGGYAQSSDPFVTIIDMLLVSGAATGASLAVVCASLETI
jgi:hypothetical protein